MGRMGWGGQGGGDTCCDPNEQPQFPAVIQILVTDDVIKGLKGPIQRRSSVRPVQRRSASTSSSIGCRNMGRRSTVAVVAPTNLVL